MNPAYSVIFFTSASGAGYGLWAWMGFMTLMEPTRFTIPIIIAGIGLGFILVTSGLLASTAHLGHPERAWRALSQWRSSWLSREGVLAILTYGPALIFVLLGLQNRTTINLGIVLTGLSLSIFSLTTLYSTAMIYRTLKTIQRWDNRFTVPLYLLHGLGTGILWLLVILTVFSTIEELKIMAVSAGLIQVFAWGVQQAYWQFIDTNQASVTHASALGLDQSTTKNVRLIEGPSTQQNYVQREMGYQIARTHSTRLRHIATWLGWGSAGLAFGFFIFIHLNINSAILASFIAFLAALAGSFGVLIQRWLFFAEARHVVQLYFGAIG